MDGIFRIPWHPRRQRKAPPAGVTGITGAGAAVCRVSHNQAGPLVFLDRARNPDLPTGATTFLANGEEYTGRFVKIALNCTCVKLFVDLISI